MTTQEKSMSTEYKWGKFPGEPRRLATPARMQVGQIVERDHVAPAYMRQLATKMRKAIAQGMEFSTATNGDTVAIRRDK